MKTRFLCALLLFLAATLAPALNAQTFCTASAGIPIVRSDGITEQVGDIILNCAGGAATPAGQPIPKYTVTLTLNTNITSRLLPLGGSLSEALLTIDEPVSSSPVPPPLPVSTIPQILCFPQGSSCTELGTGGTPSPYKTQPNMFTGRRIAPNQIQWSGVSIDPSSTAARVIRITNVRANAAQLGPSSSMTPAQVTALVGIAGAPVLSVVNPSQVVAVVQPDLIAGVQSESFSQCVPHNQILLGGFGTAAFDFNVDLREGFASAFKARNYGAVLFNPVPPQLVEQNVLGFPYNTESGFYSPSLFAASPAVGSADFGTRIRLNFSPVGEGSHLFVPVNVTLWGLNAFYPTGELMLVQTDSSGRSIPGHVPVAATALVGGVPVAEVKYDHGSAYAVYEVLSANPNMIDNATIPVALAYTSTPNFPALGDVTLSASLAPVNGLPIADPAAPLPRFAETSTAQAAYTIASCGTLPPFPPPQISVDPPSLSFVYTKGGPLPAAETLRVYGFSVPFTVANAVSSSWLKLPAGVVVAPAALTIGVDPSGLKAGVYSGRIVLTGTNHVTLSKPVSVILTVYDVPEFIMPANSLKFTYQVGQAEPESQMALVTASSHAVSLSASAIGADWLEVGPGTANTPVNLIVKVHPAGMAMGVYMGTIKITSPDIAEPELLMVTLVVNGLPPVVQHADVMNAASLVTGRVAPGEIVRIGGLNLSDDAGTLEMEMDESGKVASELGDTRVLFDNIAAPLLFVKPDQLSAVVPYEVAGRTSTRVTVECGHMQSSTLTFTVAPAVPGIFTQDASGKGQALALNEDGSANSFANPAPRGSIVVFYLTGTGQTNPGGITGGVTTQPAAAALPVSAFIDGKAAAVKYAGAAPGIVSGVTQVNVLVPADAKTGTVAVIFRFGGAHTQDRVTIAVE